MNEGRRAAEDRRRSGPRVGVKRRLSAIPRPFFGYFHFLPPHSPYRTSSEFYRRFARDGFKPIEKPIDVFADKGTTTETSRQRMQYDEYILYADKSLGDLFDFLESSGLLETTWVVLTSDHGEMFERGMAGHGSPVLYEPVIQVPLLIFEPNRRVGLEIRIPTSGIDLLPTLAHLTGHAVPDWAEGGILPPFANAEPDPNRSIYSVQARKNDPFAPLTHASVALIKGGYKLHDYYGYESLGIKQQIKLYHVDGDPEELVNVAASRKAIAAEMLNAIESELKKVDAPYL